MRRSRGQEQEKNKKQEGEVLFTNCFKRPCKIWAPYGGHCVEKSLAPKSKYVDTPKLG